VKKDTQKYGNADGRNILYKDGLEKSFSVFFVCFKNDEVVFESGIFGHLC
jgi:hypothetical protein